MGIVSDFDTSVEEQRNRNEQKLRDLGIYTLKDAMAAEAAAGSKATRPRKPREPREPVEPRRSTRERTQKTYNEDAMFEAIMPRNSRGSGGVKRPLELTAEEVEALTVAAKEARIHGAGRGASKGPRGPRDSGKGVRRQGGQVYDSSSGVTCHWCRQKTITLKVTCTNPLCGGGNRMPLSFCKRCLWNRHGEIVEAEIQGGRWICPCCRVSCGPGCTICCNCGVCRRKLGLPPTDKIKTFAEAKGFDDAHDYLVSLVTGESPEELKARKVVFLEELQKKVDKARAAATAASDEEEEEAEKAGGEVGFAEMEEEEEEAEGGKMFAEMEEEEEVIEPPQATKEEASAKEKKEKAPAKGKAPVKEKKEKAPAKGKASAKEEKEKAPAKGKTSAKEKEKAPAKGKASAKEKKEKAPAKGKTSAKEKEKAKEDQTPDEDEVKGTFKDGKVKGKAKRGAPPTKSKSKALADAN
ncbi:hypothetical protein VaNZ11_015745 [Volvox africanus]|uniref:Zinc-finger domain-containing protein n=1 Tax=Volvox africanus TaxID=51714 RepID=A0ABQ5SM64_9CHLO|nr:hypothetical protein VaNZ11_015745 [Volvox africanus]